jgi:hypothetical protein
MPIEHVDRSAALNLKRLRLAGSENHVRFAPESRHWRCTNQCLLRANSGHLFGSLDHLISRQKNAIRYVDAKRLGGFQIDY